MILRKRRLAATLWGWAASSVVHAALGVLLVAEAVALISFSFQPAAKPPQVVELAAAWSRLPKATELPPVVVETEPAVSKPPPVKPEDSDAITRPDLENRIKNAIAEADKLTPEQKLERLKILSGQLERVSSDESLTGLVSTMNKALGTTPRATQPAAEPIAGEFDFGTAQFHEVRRVEDAQGNFKYTAVLFDAAGRTTLAELDEVEGARMYQLLELIKSSPLMEKLYRGVMLGLIDKITKPGNTVGSVENP